MSIEKNSKPWDFVSCMTCGNLQSQERTACENCGAKLIHSKSAHARFIESRRIISWTAKTLTGLAMILTGPWLILTSFSIAPLTGLGIVLTGMGFPLGLWV